MGAPKAAIDPGTTLGTPVAASYFTSWSFQNQYPRPEVWVTSWWTVAFVRGSTRTGSSPSKPSSTLTSAKSGT